MAAPLFLASDLSNWHGRGTLTSAPNAGQSGTSGFFGSLGAVPAVGAFPAYNWQDINAPMIPPSADYRPEVAKGEAPLAEYASLYDASLLDATGKAKAKIPLRGKAGGPLYSRAANVAYGLAERARQEAAAKTQENLERGNAILAGYDQALANNRLMSDATLAANAGYGNSMRQQLSNDYQKRLAASNQSAMRRGLGNTTIRDSLNRGVTSAYDFSRMQLEDQLTQRNINLMGDAINRENLAASARLGFLGSIQNDYPTSADYGNYLLQSAVLEETKGSRIK